MLRRLGNLHEPCWLKLFSPKVVPLLHNTIDDETLLVPSGGCNVISSNSALPVTEHIQLLQPGMVLGSKGGVPKRKTSPERKHRSTWGWQFKYVHLRLASWYTCPLCGDPKQAETVCRKEQCRRIRP
eukprot:PhF_6_TR29026/c0_g3_i2/m.42275